MGKLIKKNIEKGYKAINIQSIFNEETNEIETTFDLQIDPKKGDFIYYNDVVAIMKDDRNFQFAYDVANEEQTTLNLDYIININTKYAKTSYVNDVKQYLISIGKSFNEETKEVENVWKPKIGDVCRIAKKDFLFVYGGENDYYVKAICAIKGSNCYFLVNIDKWSNAIFKIYKASPEEEKRLLDRIASEGYKLSEDRTEIIKVKKRVNINNYFYYLTLEHYIFVVKISTDKSSIWDDKLYYYGNYYITKKAAQKAADELNAKLDLKKFFKNSKEK